LVRFSLLGDTNTSHKKQCLLAVGIAFLIRTY
jgi:hypothetical protein